MLKISVYFVKDYVKRKPLRIHLVNVRVTCKVTHTFISHPPQHLHNPYTVAAHMSFQLIKGYGYETKPSATLPEACDNVILLFFRFLELNKQWAYTVF